MMYIPYYKDAILNLGEVAHIFNPRTQESRGRRISVIFETNLIYITCFKPGRDT